MYGYFITNSTYKVAKKKLSLVSSISGTSGVSFNKLIPFSLFHCLRIKGIIIIVIDGGLLRLFSTNK